MVTTVVTNIVITLPPAQPGQQLPSQQGQSPAQPGQQLPSQQGQPPAQPGQQPPSQQVQGQHSVF